MKLLSRVQLFVTPWTVAYQAPPSMGFSRQEYWSGVPFPSPGDLPNTGIEHCRQMLYRLSHQGSPSLKEIMPNFSPLEMLTMTKYMKYGFQDTRHQKNEGRGFPGVSVAKTPHF